MLLQLTPAEALGLASMSGAGLPSFVTSVSADADTVRVTADLRRLGELPGPLKLAARLTPVVRADVRVLGFADGRATLEVEAHAGGLPVGKLLGLLAGPLSARIAAQGLPDDAIAIRPDASVVVDVEALLAARLPGLTVTDVRVEGGEVVVRAAVG
ncbi:hypothetical protein ET495_00700 [Xylanimonas allomyrinae]|uniref:DUF2993 domain-containing protein n=1 Tax=Xylanimonas allomyrinae TaxID=2509459 RepID=A0A4V0YDV7_9MICO|nr:hypothetical protein [Xylanimonas allomyrinae]QAY62051.1 hypothetical protein ET495_00700 [Xylanimonas allomyrinae]